ncbi:MAG: ABC transporter permease [Clostridiales bacterium]|nr:ABC transporter permease [Clostridiales bacterium]
MKTKSRDFTMHPLFLPLLVLAVLIIYNAIFVPGFFKFQMIDGVLHGRIIDIINRSSALIIVAIGMTFVIGTGGIDISVGSIIAITGAVAAYFIGDDVGATKMNLGLVILISLVVGCFCGIWNAFLIAKLKIQPWVATLILQTAGRGIAMLITQGQILTVYYKPFSYIGNFIPGFPLPTTVLIAIIFIILVFLIMKKTSVGMFIQAVGVNPRAAYLSGIKVTSVLFIVYIFSGLCSGVGGLIEASMISAADSNNAGLGFEANAILSVALGGTLLSGGKFNLVGSIIGAITIQTLTTTMYARGVSSIQLPIIQGLMILFICLFQSERFRNMIYKSKTIRSN